MTRFATFALCAGMLCAMPPLVAQQAPADTTTTAAPLPSPADSALEAQTAAVASQLRCPICQGESLQDSPAELAQQMRSVVKEQLRAGKTPAQVKAYFVSKYGEWILLDPRPHGFNLVLYAIPFVLVLGGLGVTVFAVRKWTRPSGNEPPSATA